jgi:hypothetical protein
VVYERSAARQCGWPLCAQSLSETSGGKYKVVRRLGALVEASTARAYCTSRCLMASKLYQQQLSTEPVYLRTVFAPPVIDQFDGTAPLVLDQPRDSTALVITERDPDGDIVDLPNLESVNAQAIEGYSHAPKNSTPISEEVKARAVPPNSEPDDARHSDAESDSEADSVDEDLFSNFFISNKEIPMPELSLFGSVWTMLSRWVTADTRQWLRDEESPVTDVTREVRGEIEAEISFLPVVDSEAPTLIRRNTVKSLVFK